MVKIIHNSGTHEFDEVETGKLMLADSDGGGDQYVIEEDENDGTLYIRSNGNDNVEFEQNGDTTFRGNIKTKSNKIIWADGSEIVEDANSNFEINPQNNVSVVGGNLDINSNRVTNLGTPTNGGDAVSKSYADGLIDSIKNKESVVAATDGGNIDLSSATDPNPVDGVTLSDGDRVLLKDQTTDSENGIYDVVTATDPTTWTRSSDFDQDDEVTEGSATFVENGTINANTRWAVNSSDPISVGTSSINFIKVSALGQINVNDGLEKTGDTINLRMPIEDSGVSVSDAFNINFGSNISVSNDNDNTVTVDGTDTRTDVSDSGTGVVSSVDDINFGNNISVTDDGDGSVTVDGAGDTDTRIDVSDSGSLVVSEPDDVNFGSNLVVSDDGDGSVTVDAQSSTDTRTDVSEDGSLVESNVEDINFSTNVNVDSDGDGSVTVDTDDTNTQLDDEPATSNVQVGGNIITDVGGIVAANAGSIRIANNNSIAWRNSGDTDDGTLKYNSFDEFQFVDSGGAAIVSFSGGNVIDIGGTTDANSGAIRMSNAKAIAWRNNADSADLLLATNSNDELFYNDGNGSQLAIRPDLDIQGNNIVKVGGTNDATSGEIRMANGSQIAGRNNANDADITMLQVGTGDVVNIGGSNGNLDGINLFGGTGDVEVREGTLQVNDNKVKNDAGEKVRLNLAPRVTISDGDRAVLSSIPVPAGKQVKVYVAGIDPSGVSGLNLEVRNTTDGVDVYSNNVGYESGQPLSSGATGDTIEVRASNSSGSSQDVTAFITMEIV